MQNIEVSAFMKYESKRVKNLFYYVKKNASKHFANIVLIIGTTWLISDATWTIINVYDYYKGTQSLENNKLLWIIVLLLPMVISSIYFIICKKINNLKKKIEHSKNKNLNNNEIIHFYRNIIDDCFDDIYNGHKKILTQDIEQAKINENWDEVIRLGKHGARLFLILSRYDLRITYGNYIIEAAEQKGDKESIAMGYIDCIGWSYVKKGEYEKADKNIKKGLSLLSNNNSSDSIVLKCKANRHLIGIALREKDKSNSKIYRTAFEVELKKLKGPKKKLMLASLNIIDGDIAAIENYDYEVAKKHYKLAHKLFLECEDIERAVKVQYKLGHVNEKMGQYPKALREYLIGFYQSEIISRIDEKYNNCIGICRIISIDEIYLNDVFSDKKFEKELSKEKISLVKSKEYYINTKNDLKKKIGFVTNE